MRPSGVRRLLHVPRFGRGQLAREIDEEIAFHLAQRAERLRASGMPAAEAWAAAALRFGDLSEVRGACMREDTMNVRRERLVEFFEHMLADVRYAGRSFRRAPGFATTAFLTLTLGIAALSSIFSYYNAAYHGVLPYTDVGRLVAFDEVHAKSRWVPAFASVSPEALALVRASSRSLERVSAYTDDYTVVVVGSDPQGLRTLRIDTAFIPLFGLHAQLGRLPSFEETRDRVPVAAISDRLWRSAYGADDHVLGRSITLHGVSCRIIGVLPAGFEFPYKTDIAAPFARPAAGDAAGANAKTNQSVQVVAKLRPGATRTDARAELALIGQRLSRSGDPRLSDVSLVLRDEPLDRKARQFLPHPFAFLAAGLLVLLIACSNVANLFYVRTAERRAEMAVRASLGAARGRLLRQALAESILLSGAAAVAGTALAYAAVKLFLHVVPTSGFPGWFHVAVDRRVLAFACGMAVLTVIVAGLAPAAEATRVDVISTLKGSGDLGATRRITRRSRGGLVVQLALATSLFVAATLLGGSYARLSDLDFGYPAWRIAFVMPFLQSDRYPDAVAQTRFATEVSERTSDAGITAAVMGGGAHLRDIPDSVWERRSGSERLIPDGDSARSALDRNVQVAVVSQPFFEILRLRTRAGRTFLQSDREGGPPVVVISSRTAELLWPGQSPIGRTLQVGADGERATVIGVVDDRKDIGSDNGGQLTSVPRPAVYFSTRQAVSWNPDIIASGQGGPALVRKLLIQRLHEIDPTILVGNESTLATGAEALMFTIRIFGGILVALAVCALLLAVIGIYGLVAFGVAQRRREFGIRIAVGATGRQVIGLVLRETMQFALIGLTVGFVLAGVGGRTIRSFLFGVSAVDPVSYLFVAVLFAGVTALAAYVPARRTSRIDPVAALRTE